MTEENIDEDAFSEEQIKELNDIATLAAIRDITVMKAIGEDIAYRYTMSKAKAEAKAKRKKNGRMTNFEVGYIKACEDIYNDLQEYLIKTFKLDREETQTEGETNE